MPTQPELGFLSLAQVCTYSENFGEKAFQADIINWLKIPEVRLILLCIRTGNKAS